MTKRTSIPVYSIKDATPRGVMISKFSGVKDGEERKRFSAHRDENYMFILIEKGSGTVMVDFKEVHICENAVFCILPGQVHAGRPTPDIIGWFIALDVSLVPDNFRSVFEEKSTQLCPVPINAERVNIIKKGISLLTDVYSIQDESCFLQQIIHSFVHGLTGIFADAYIQHTGAGNASAGRPAAITRQFRSLLLLSYKTMKSPSAYAGALNISAAWLNEAVKLTTGFSVSYWIHQEVIMEAKRMLCFTDVTVKEIAYGLGYNDHTYFSRLFTSAEGLSPLAFRRLYRE